VTRRFAIARFPALGKMVFSVFRNCPWLWHQLVNLTSCLTPCKMTDCKEWIPFSLDPFGFGGVGFAIDAGASIVGITSVSEEKPSSTSETSNPNDPVSSLEDMRQINSRLETF